MPIIGIVDERRGLEITEGLLQAISERRADYVIIDVTAIDTADTHFAHHLVKSAKAARLLGSRCILSGLSPAVAQTLSQMGIELTGLMTLRDLQSALHECIAALERTTARETMKR